VIKHVRNHNATYASCPVLSDNEALHYLARGEIPSGAHYLEVPPGKIIKSRGFWLNPTNKMHHAANAFLISTNAPTLNPDDIAERKPVLCYRSQVDPTFYLGYKQGAYLEPLTEGHYPPIPLSRLTYVGHVIASI